MSFDIHNQRRSIEESEFSGNWKTEKKKKGKKEGTSWPSKEKAVLWIKQYEQVEQQVTPPIQILMWTYHNGVKQAVVKRNIMECVSVGEKVMLRLKMKKWNGKLLKWNRLKYLSAAKKFTL